MREMLHRISDRIAMFPQTLGLDPFVQDLQCVRSECLTHYCTLIDGDAVSGFYFCGKPYDVPIGKTNTTVAGSAADRIGVIGPVNSNTLFVECNPHYANTISPAGCRNSTRLNSSH